MRSVFSGRGSVFIRIRESRRGDYYRSIQAQRVLIIALEDTVSGSERLDIVMIDVALKK